MRLHTIYRTTGSENRKARPEWYSKSLAVESYLGSLGAVGDAGDLVFVVDGPMADTELVRLRRAGEVVQLDGVGNSSSYRWALDIVYERPSWADDELVYFAEDDYLYPPGALPRCLELRRAVLRGRVPHPTTCPMTTTSHSPLPGAARARSLGRRRRDVASGPLHHDDLRRAGRRVPKRRPAPRAGHVWSLPVGLRHLVGSAHVRLGVFAPCLLSLPYSPRTTRVRGPRTRSRGRCPRPGPVVHRDGLSPAEAPMATHCEAVWLTPGADWAVIADGLSLTLRGRWPFRRIEVRSASPPGSWSASGTD